MDGSPSILLLFTVCVLGQASALPAALEGDEDFKKEILTERRRSVDSFSWRDCGGPSSPMSVTSLEISPVPIVCPGALYVAADIIATASLGAPLTGYLLMEKKVLGHYVEIPCIDGFGSCTYNNLCELLKQVQCPSSIEKTGWNCRCPISPGTYSMPKSEFDINEPLPSGDYHIMGNVTHGTNPGVCLDLWVSFDD